MRLQRRVDPLGSCSYTFSCGPTAIEDGFVFAKLKPVQLASEGRVGGGSCDTLALRCHSGGGPMSHVTLESWVCHVAHVMMTLPNVTSSHDTIITPANFKRHMTTVTSHVTVRVSPTTRSVGHGGVSGYGTFLSVETRNSSSADLSEQAKSEDPQGGWTRALGRSCSMHVRLWTTTTGGAKPVVAPPLPSSQAAGGRLTHILCLGPIAIWAKRGPPVHASCQHR